MKRSVYFYILPHINKSIYQSARRPECEVETQGPSVVGCSVRRFYPSGISDLPFGCSGYGQGRHQHLRVRLSRKNISLLLLMTAPSRPYAGSFRWFKGTGSTCYLFLMGSCIPGNEALVKRMQEEGHLIGNPQL